MELLSEVARVLFWLIAVPLLALATLAGVMVIVYALAIVAA